ncbi:diacylglycerol kinase family protein [Croceicoccus sp. F390]|uniref:Diacylglycerol kinase family protein n=1 Tax=Croceicoccus esteveae TaxID=3075597 RepID=A0ABU2ZG75_9SPHN|nr:diacylglycerol kinase family protein [Croceicoccus sp. F390]MDT0575400.1 diacylglycerol kinase family protein [Croceicoccus sp. F390]
MTGSFRQLGTPSRLPRAAMGEAAPLQGRSSRAHPGNAAQALVIVNPRSHRNRVQRPVVPSGVQIAEPKTRESLHDVLARAQDNRVGLIIIAGGDGTVRDVLSCAGTMWGHDAAPAVAVLPRGKTNALALDLGVPRNWDVADAIAAWRSGQFASRRPIEIYDCNPSDGDLDAPRGGERQEPPCVRGYLFGAGAFVLSTDLAQKTHHLGAFNNLAVALSTAGTVLNVAFGRDSSPWRAGQRMRIRYDRHAKAMHNAALDSDAQRFIMLVTTLETMPLGIKPFGPPRAGMKALIVDAPPRRFVRMFAKIIRGSTDPALEDCGAHRVDADTLDIELDGGFIFDGERFAAGRYRLKKGAPVQYVIP